MPKSKPVLPSGPSEAPPTPQTPPSGLFQSPKSRCSQDSPKDTHSRPRSSQYTLALHKPHVPLTNDLKYTLQPAIYHRSFDSKVLYQATIQTGERQVTFAAVGFKCECVGPETVPCAPPLVRASQILWDSIALSLKRDPSNLEVLLVTLRKIDSASVPACTQLSLEWLASPHPLYNSHKIPPLCRKDIVAADLVNSIKTLLTGCFVSKGQLMGCVRGDRLLLFRIGAFKAKGSPNVAQIKDVEKLILSIRLYREDEPEQAVIERPRGFARVGGLRELRPLLETVLLYQLIHPEKFFEAAGQVTFRGPRPPKGVLLYGAPGTGKSFVSEALAEEVELRWQSRGIDDEWICPRIKSFVRPPHEVDAALKNVFRECEESFVRQNQRTLLIIDEIDSICPSREHASEASIAATTTLLTHLDGTDAHPGVVVLATTNRPDALDEAIRRPGRIDLEVEVEVPDRKERMEILSKLKDRIAGRVEGLETAEELMNLAAKAHGFVPADLELWCSRAVEQAQAEAFENTGEVRVRKEHFEAALKSIRPSGLKELVVEVPDTRWSDIGGYEEVKQRLRESVEWPLKHWKIFEAMKMTAPRGILLYGPPGNSKTIMAKAVASESSMNFIAVKGPEIFSKWVGESERTIRTIFRKARQHAPSIIFFDEIDALGSDRQSGEKGGGSGVESRVLSQMLNEMDGIGSAKQVVIIGATNRPDLLDAALLRPGRLDRLLYVPLPNHLARAQIFDIHLRGVALEDDDTPEVNAAVPKRVDGAEISTKDWLAEQSEGYSGAEIAFICREARMAILREIIESGRADEIAEGDLRGIRLTRNSFKRVFDASKPRTPSSLIEFYERYAASHTS